MNLVGQLGAAAVVLLSLVSPAAAQGFRCAFAPAIVSLSNTVLTKRLELAKFPRRNSNAAEAAYLTIMYTPLDDSEAEPLLQDLIDDGARGVDEVAFAWSYGKEGTAITERMLGTDAATNLVSIGSISAIRAMIREGGEDDLLTIMSGFEDSARIAAYKATAVAILDHRNEWRRQIAAAALDRGMVELAALFVALDDKGSKAWAKFAERLDDPALVNRVTQLWQWAPAFAGHPELPRTAEQGPAAHPQMKARVHDVFIAAAKAPQIDFLMTILNQTGEIEKVGAAADALRAAVESGAIARNGTFGPAWLLEYRVLREQWADDLDYLLSTLKTFDYQTPKGARKPLEVLDELIAIEALTPYLRGKIDTIPDRPNELSADFVAWPQWTETAAKVKGNPADPALSEETVFPIAAELLFAADEIDALTAAFVAAPAAAPTLRLSNDMAMRLDRRCSGYLYYPTEAVQGAPRPLFKFDG